ncbi:MAG: PAS domain S-box protein [Methanolobus sp.]|nr:PAS domain S-box protein [Methanolobus sp.]
MDGKPALDKDMKAVPKIIVLYVILSTIWILFSDILLGWMVSDMVMYACLQTYKGLAFILATSALFLLYIKPRIETLNQSQRTLSIAEKELKRRLDYELATVKCMRLLLEPAGMDKILPRILETVHSAVGNSRTYVFRNEDDPELGLCMSQIYEVVADGITQEIDNPLLKHLPYSEGAPNLLGPLQSRQPYAHVVAELDDPERTILAEQGILSVLILPVFCGQELWGFVGFDDCENVRKWHEDDINLLWIVADGIGGAILRKKAEKELKESEERFKALHNASFGGITIHDKGIIMDCNQGLSEIFGYIIEELAGMDVMLLIAEDSRDTIRNNVLSGFEESYEVMGLRKDGTEFPVRLEAKSIPYKGKMVRVVEFRDITEQKKAEEALQQTTDRLMLAARAANVGIWDYDIVNNVLVWDEQMFRLYGITQDQFSGAYEAWRTGLHPDEVERGDSEIQMALQGEKEFDTEFRVLWPNGNIRNIRALAIVQRDESGQPVRMIGTNWDITAQKHAEEELRESERKYHSLFNQSAEGIFLHDFEGNIIDVNNEAVVQSGYSKDELLNLTVFSFLPSEFDRNDILHQWSQWSPGTTVTLEARHLHKDGSVYPVEMTTSCVQFGSRKLILAMVRDITERKKAEHSLIEAKMMAEENSRIKSEFLANMSHELRTPLTAILGFSDMLGSEMFGQLNEKQLRFADHIHKSGEHLLELINDVLDLSKIEAGKMELECENFSVSKVFAEIQTLMAPLAARKKIDLRIENNIQTTEIFADRLKFKQIMYNLLSNAIKFTPDQGKVLVVAKNNDNEIHVSVSDSGIGIPENRMEDIFNPFTQVDASNKRRYGGTGLGLTLVKQFVEMQNGRVWVESREGEGSTFTFTVMNQNCDKEITEISEVQ